LLRRGRRRSAESLALLDLQNDLEAPVAAHHPQIARLVRTLRKAGASHAAMSGSGSAVFALFAHRSGADGALRALRGLPSRRPFATLLTRTLNRRRFQALARM
jgi:4-diphosphocytidyl-2C-methyl-D-erythritol kinase